MALNSIRKIAVVGTGTIGSSWTTLFLAKGFKVTVSDPAPGAKEKLAQFIQREWPRMQNIGLAKNADPKNFEFVDDIYPRLHDIDFVQENCPERADFKTDLIGQIDAKLPKHAIIASSSSGIPSSQFISKCGVDPNRVLIGHPFNPPHLIPLVEIVPHSKTTSAAVDGATAFYKSLGKAPVLLKKEAPGFLANRLQAAVIAEAYSLVHHGIASPEDVDTAISSGPGIRWAFAGPFMTEVFAGGGGQDGFSHTVNHLVPALAGWVEDMNKNKFSFNKQDITTLTEQVTKWQKSTDTEAAEKEMNDGIVNVLQFKKDTKL